MKKPELMLNKCFKRIACSNLANPWRRVTRLMIAGAALIAASLLSPLAQAQTIMTIKPFQVRVEVPVGSSGMFYVNPCTLRIPTNGASGTDITGTNWIIADVNVSISGTPLGCTASLVDSGLVNPIGAIPINMNTNNGSKSTNLVVKLVFDGTVAGGVTTLAITATGGGLPNDTFLLPLEVAKIWNGSANAALNGAGTWGSLGSWLGTGAPGPNDNVVFTDVGTQTNSILNGTTLLTNCIIDTSTVISSLRFSQTNSTINYHNLFINPGVDLAIKGNDGFSMLRDYTYWNQVMRVSIYGTNGTLILTNENANFSILSEAQQNSLLDMSGLGNLRLDVNHLYLSDYMGYPNYQNLVYTNNYSSTTAGAGKPQRFYQTWRMAGTNYVRAVYVDPQNYTNSLTRSYALVLGRNEASGGGSGQDVEMYMGYTNVFNLDGMCVAGSFCLGADLRFLNNNSYAKFRNTDGVSRMSIFATADAGGPTQAAGLGDNTKCGGSGPGVDFTRGTVDMLVDRLYLSMDRANVTASGKGVSQTSGFYFSSGIIDANTAILGYQSEGTQTNQSYCYANMFVTNTAVLRVNGTLALGYATAVPGSVNAENLGYGKLNIGPGGTVMANNITVGGVTKVSVGNNIVLTGGASLIVSNGIADATPNGALGTLSFGGNCSLTLFIDGSKPRNPFVYLSTLSGTSTGNKLIIGGVSNLTYPAYVPLIAGVGPLISASTFDAGVVMPPGLFGVLTTSSSNTIDLVITDRTPGKLLWRGPAGLTGTADWDHTSAYWLDQNTLLMTNYTDPDIVAFDDTPGYATNINLAGGPTALMPAAINMTNSALYYTFLNGPNQIIGGPPLNKQGTGTVEVDGNTTVTVQLNQGVLTGFSPGSVGGVTVVAGAVMNYSGAIGGSLNCSGTATSSGSIAGTVTVLSGGVVTNSGTVANPFSVQVGGLLYNSASGALNNIGTGSSGSPQVARGGKLINNGSIGRISGGNVLFVNGTFEDLGGGSMTLQSVSVGSGGTFIPGGDGIGTTTINNDGSTTFDGAALLAQGSTNIFKVDAGSPANTMLTAAHLSFGASASQQTQNGCTLVISNISVTPFSAGQSFQLFNNVYIPGTAPYSTGSSTNTYPVISPATPGPGLAWDLTYLWRPNLSGNSGRIGVISASGGPVLANSFAIVGGSNIVAQFSWDASYLGYRLQSLVTPLTVGLTDTNWGGVAGSWTNTTMTITNVLGTNCVFYRLTFP
jgi:hypothetical protein